MSEIKVGDFVEFKRGVELVGEVNKIGDFGHLTVTVNEGEGDNIFLLHKRECTKVED